MKEANALTRLAFVGMNYKHVTVHLIGEDGNAFSIIGRTIKALRKAGATAAERHAFITEVTSGDYNHVLQTVMQVVTVSGHCHCHSNGEDE